MVQEQRGGVGMYGLPGEIQLPICDTLEEFLESVALYGIGVIRNTMPKQDGCRMGFLRSQQEAEEDIKRKGPG